MFYVISQVYTIQYNHACKFYESNFISIIIRSQLSNELDGNTRARDRVLPPDDRSSIGIQRWIIQVNDFPYQAEQIPFGKGRFNGRIYLPDSDDDLEVEESTVPARKEKAPISTLRSKSPSSSPWAHDKPTHSKGKSNEKQKRKRLPSSHQILRIDRNTTRLPNVPNVPTAGDDNKENLPITDHRKDSEGSTDAVLKQIQKTNDLLGVVAKRLDSTERRLSKMEDDIRSTKSS